MNEGKLRMLYGAFSARVPICLPLMRLHGDEPARFASQPGCSKRASSLSGLAHFHVVATGILCGIRGAHSNFVWGGCQHVLDRLNFVGPTNVLSCPFSL